MEIALQNGFYELHDEEMLDVTAGGWGEFALATAGVLCIAASPIVLATGNIPGAMILAGTGCGLIGSIA
jgi:hypothetical protein